MPILKHAAWAILALTVSCAPAGPLTPRQTFAELKTAFAENDPDKILKLVSAASLEKISFTCRTFRELPEVRTAAIAGEYGIPAAKMKTLTPREFMALYLAQTKNDNLIRAALAHRVVYVGVKDNRASVKVENGMELAFVKDGPYWKLDFTGI